MTYDGREPVFVTAGEISRNFGRWQDKAMETPVVVTHHGRPRVVMIASDHYRPAEQASPNLPDAAGAKLGALMNQIAEAFLALDADLRIMAVNPVFEAYVGRAAFQIVGRLWVEVFPKLEGSLLHEHYRRVLRTGEVAEFEVASVMYPGRVVTQTVFPYGGGVAALFVNRTGERERERQIEVANSIEQLARAIPGLSLIEVNIRGGIAKVDGRFSALSGFDTDALVRFRLADIVLPRDRSRLLASIDQALEDEAIPSLRTCILSRDGQEKEVIMTLAPIRQGLRPVALKVAVLSVSSFGA